MPSLPRKLKKVAPRDVFVDTSGWIAFFSYDDRHHVKADELIGGAAGEGKRLITSNLILVEVHRLLLFRAGVRAASTALDRIAASPSAKVVFATREHYEASRRWLDKLHDQVITLADATSFAVMAELRCRQAISFDSDFWTAGFERFELTRRR